MDVRQDVMGQIVWFGRSNIPEPTIMEARHTTLLVFRTTGPYENIAAAEFI
jgi:hypothetical protein